MLGKLNLWAASILALVSIYLPSYQMDSYGVPLRFGVFVIGITLALLLVFFSEPGRMFISFTRDSGVELRKVVWPSKEETIKLTGVVFVLVFIITTFLWLVDWFLSSILDTLAGI